LANGLGNLVNRALSMLAQYFDSVVPEGNGEFGLRTAAIEATPSIEAAYARLDFSGALNSIWEVISLGNRVIEEQKPWAKIKAGERESVAALLRELLAACQWCAVTLSPVMPHVAQRLLSLLEIEAKPSWALANDFTDLLTAGHKCAAPQPLFPRIKDTTVYIDMETPTDKNAAETEPGTTAGNVIAADTPTSTSSPTDAAAPSEPAVTEAAAQPEPPIEYADFAKVQLRAARILEAERVPKADKLLKLQVDLGTEKRQILAGIAQQFEPESLIGKTIVVVANLAPRKMRGLESQGMLLAASAAADGPPSGLVTIDADVPPGSIIR
jgi:methionyl-tRNA synthetase